MHGIVQSCLVAIAARRRSLYGPADMKSASDNHARAIRLWLWAVAVLVIALVLVGGATRLTESGLSIVE
jgi:Cytochrome oxidase assembly protein